MSPPYRPRGAGQPALVCDPATSARMAGIRQKGTTPELAVRRALHAMGLRFRVDNRDLPGSPDIANRARAWAIFVHGCYWHRHPGCKRTTNPKRNRAFWEQKFETNRKRDAGAQRALRAHGFRVVVVWECETEREDFRKRLERKLRRMGITQLARHDKD